MSVHAQFTLMALIAFAVSVPAVIAAWIARLPDRQLATALYSVGYAFIGATLLLDPILNPPLFYHGFFPGVGIGAILIALALIARAFRRRDRS